MTSVMFSCQELEELANQARENEQEQATTGSLALSIECSSSELAECASDFDGKPVSGGLFVGATCADLISGAVTEDPFVYNMSDNDDIPASCDLDGCSAEADEWFPRSEDEEEDLPVTRDLVPGTYSLAVMIDSDPEIDSDGPSAGDIVFCVEDAVTIEAGDETTLVLGDEEVELMD